MKNLLSVRDAAGRHMVLLSLDDRVTRQAAADVVFDILGTPDPQALASNGTLAEGQVEDFQALQRMIFDQDNQGMFIRNDINFVANGKDLDPDAPLSAAMVHSQKQGIDYNRCELVVTGGGAPAGDSAQDASNRDSMRDLAYLMFIHQLAMGAEVDVTKEYAELIDLIARAEKEGLIEVDVKRASYGLTEKGKRTHASFIEEAQDLIKRYDIFGDVDVDARDIAHFDTGYGRDLRVAVYEMEGINPYRARFLLGLNDGEWDRMDNWMSVLDNENWYREIFRPIDTSPSIEDVGSSKLKSIIDQGKAKLRQGY